MVAWDISRNRTCQQSLFNATLAAWPGDRFQNRGQRLKIHKKQETQSKHLIVLGSNSRHDIVNLEHLLKTRSYVKYQDRQTAHSAQDTGKSIMKSM